MRVFSMLRWPSQSWTKTKSPPAQSMCVAIKWRLCRYRHNRHTYGSHLAMKGVPLLAIQQLMGHVEIKMTLRYAHLSPDSTRNAVRLLDERGGSGTWTAHAMVGTAENPANSLDSQLN